MDWKRILRILAIASVIMLIASMLSSCKRDTSKIIDWDECSQTIGDHPCDFTLIDQNGEEFNLYDHKGKIVILDFSAMWCGPCMMAAKEIEDLQNKYNDDIIYVTILIENQNYKPPTQANIKKWAYYFGIKSAPVLASSREFLSTDPNIGWSVYSWPQFHIINKEMILETSFSGFRPGNIESIILGMLSVDTGSP